MDETIKKVPEMKPVQEIGKVVIDAVGVKDDLGTEIEAEQRKTLTKEIKLFTKNRESSKKGKANFEEQWLVDNEIYEIILKGDNMKKLNPDFGYETDDRYWDLRNSQLSYKYRMDKHMSEAKLEEYDRQVEIMNEKVKIAEDALALLGEAKE